MACAYVGCWSRGGTHAAGEAGEGYQPPVDVQGGFQGLCSSWMLEVSLQLLLLQGGMAFCWDLRGVHPWWHGGGGGVPGPERVAWLRWDEVEVAGGQEGAVAAAWGFRLGNTICHPPVRSWCLGAGVSAGNMQGWKWLM